MRVVPYDNRQALVIKNQTITSCHCYPTPYLHFPGTSCTCFRSRQASSCHVSQQREARVCRSYCVYCMKQGRVEEEPLLMHPEKKKWAARGVTKPSQKSSGIIHDGGECLT